MATEQRFVYLAHPIDQNTGSESEAVVAMYGFLERTKGELQAAGIGYYDPETGWGVPRGLVAGPEIERVNHHALSVATGVVAFVLRGLGSVGTPMEITKAKLGWAKPVAVITDMEDDAWSLQQWGVTVFDTKMGVTTAVKEAVTWLAAQAAGMSPFDRGSARKLPLPYITAPGELHPRLTRSYADDAGLDLWVAEDTRILPGEFADVPSGIDGIELPPDTWGMVTGRSSTLRTKGLLVHAAVIDGGWRGPLYAGAFNVSDKAVVIRKGERIAQLILFHNSTAAFQPTQVEILSESERGTNGFGSTGA